MRIRSILWWSIPAALLVTLAAVAFGVTWQGDRQAGPDVVYAGTWTGNWTTSTGHWIGTINFKFDDGGDKVWTEAEKKVLREAVKEWEDLADSNIDFNEVTSGEDITLRWAQTQSRDAVALDGGDAGIMTGGTGNNAPTGVDFHSDPTAGIYVDATPTCAAGEVIPAGQWDLMSVAKHEIGHVLGLKHSYKADGVENVDWDVWTPGQRQCLTAKDGTAAKKLYSGGVGGIAEVLVDSSAPPAGPADGSGPSAALYAALASGIAAAVVALAAGGWYARRRWLR